MITIVTNPAIAAWYKRTCRRESCEWLLGADGIGPVIRRTPGGDDACGELVRV